MAIELRTTKGATVSGVRALVYGGSGVGKTTLIRTLPNPIILSAEAGLLSLSGSDIPYIEITDIEKLKEAYTFVVSSDYSSVALDSISEIAEICLSAEKKKTKDGRAAYGALAEIIGDLIRAFRDIPGKNIFFIGKMEKVQDGEGKILYGPSMPGKTLTEGLAYHFDLVMPLIAGKNSEGEVIRALMTQTDGIYQAKDRSGRLEVWESPDLSAIIAKIKGV